MHGRPSSDLTEAGLLVHSLDRFEEANAPWLPQSPTSPMSCSITNARHRHIFSATKGGIIIAPLKRLVMCSYTEDGGTSNKPGLGCRIFEWEVVCNAVQVWSCVWSPERLGEMLRASEARVVTNKKQSTFYSGGYNEVMLNTTGYVERLPESLEAFFVPGPADEAEVQRMRSIRASFLERYGRATADIPLVRLDLESEAEPVRLL